MGIRNGLPIGPHVDRGMGFQPKRELQRLDRSVQRDGLFFRDHGASVSELTANVNTLTGAVCKFADMPFIPLNERAQSARIRAGLKPQQAADAIGCSRPTVLRWEKDAASIGSDYLLDAARVYKVRPDWLAMKTDDDGYPWEPTEGQRVKVHAYEIKGVDGEDGIDPTQEVMIPVHDIMVSGGPGTIIPEYVETKYRLPYQIDWLNRWGAKPADILIAKVNGSSMEPILWHGDKAVIHRGRRAVKDGLVYSLIYGGDARVKRLYRLADGSLRINSANPDKDQYPDEIIAPGDMGAIYVIGQVIDKMGSGGLGF